MTHEPGEGPLDPATDKARAKAALEHPDHRKPKSSPEDEATRDDDLPGLQDGAND